MHADSCPSCVLESANGVILLVRLQPNASRSRVLGRNGDRLRVAVSAPPEKGRANTALQKLLAEMLGVCSSQIRLLRGRTSRQKDLLIAGLPIEDVLARLSMQ
ncbi:MAG: DUF167 domain-containing protein [Planctomycetaceae bacterium]|jgi:uncharacterized protein (TIGR00251 family)